MFFGEHVSESNIITCEGRWELICELSWRDACPAYSNEKEMAKLPSWLRQERLPFISDFNDTQMEGYIWDSNYLYRLEWKPGDSTDHLQIYRAKRVDVQEFVLEERRKLSQKLKQTRTT